MNDLIERLEKATGPDIHLDFAISVAIRTPGRPVRTDSQGFPLDIKNYTSSLDEALTLVPRINEPERGIWWQIEQNAGSLGSGKTFYTARITVLNHGKHKSFVGMGDAPIALCIAALKAREQTSVIASGTHSD